MTSYNDTSKSTNTNNAEFWQQLFAERILSRGKSYFNAGKVKNVALTGQRYTATVEGTTDYSVEVVFDGTYVDELNCTCEYAAKGMNCKHEAALLFAISDGSTVKKDNPGLQTACAHSEKLDRSIAHWKSELLDTSKRNRMINFRETARSTLKLLEPSAEVLFNKLYEDRKLTFQQPVSRSSDLRTYALVSLFETLSYSLPFVKGDIKAEGTIIEREKTLKNLRSKAKLAREEQGTNILYACFGFIHWRENSQPGTPWLKSPLLMMPVVIEQASLNAPFTIRRGDDEVEVNPTLDYLFNAEYNIDLPTFERTNRDSFAEYLAKIEKIVDQNGWKVEAEASIGLLSFLKISMYHDLDNNRPLLQSNPILRAIAGDTSALTDVPAEAEDYRFDDANPREWHEVVNSDSSQEEAILLSKMGVSFVMQGPPGTGKSQTITNIIAEALAADKRVLFVSEKAAALQVVLKRLTEVGLADFCLPLHSHRANKKEIIDSIGANLSLAPDRTDYRLYRELDELFKNKQLLNAYAEELHAPVEPLGDSIYTAFGKIAAYKDVPDFEFHIQNPLDITKEGYNALRYCASEYDRTLRAVGFPLSANPWCDTWATAASAAYRKEFISSTSGLSDILRKTEEIIKKLNAEYGTSVSHTWSSVSKALPELQEAMTLPQINPEWTDARRLAEITELVKNERQEQDAYAAVHGQFSKVFSDDIFDSDAMHELQKAGEAIARLQKYIGSSVPASQLCLQTGSIKKLAESLGDFSAQYRTAAELLSFDGIDSFENAEKLFRIIGLINGCRHALLPEWFRAHKRAAALNLTAEIAEHISALNGAKDKIDAICCEQVYNPDIRTKLDRFTDEYLRETATAEDLGETICGRLSVNRELYSNLMTASAALDEAAQLIQYDCGRNADNLLLFSHILPLIINAKAFAADWFDSRKTDKIYSLIDEARRITASVKEKTDKLFAEWEPSILTVDAVGILTRFKVEYTGLFRKLKPGYKQDTKLMRAHFRSIGQEIDEAKMIEALQLVKAVNEENKWFDDNFIQLNAYFGAEYNGAGTDWDSVIESINCAHRLMQYFPYETVPDKTAQAIILLTKSMQLTAEARRLSDILTAERMEKLLALLNSDGSLVRCPGSVSIDEVILPQLDNGITSLEMYLEAVDSLKPLCRKPALCSRDFIAVRENLSIIDAETEWFGEKENIAGELLGSDYCGYRTDTEGISRALRLIDDIQKTLDGKQLSETAKEKLCSYALNGISAPVNALSPESIFEYRSALRRISPMVDMGGASVSEGILVLLNDIGEACAEIMDVTAGLDGYISAADVPRETVIDAIPTVFETATLRSAVLERAEKNAAALGDAYSGINTDWNALYSNLVRVQKFMKASHASLSQDTVGIILSDTGKMKEFEGLCNRLTYYVKSGDAGIEYFQNQFRYADYKAIPMQAVYEHYEQCIENFDVLGDWLSYTEARENCSRNGLSEFARIAADAADSNVNILEAFEKGFYLQWINAAIETMPKVKAFRRNNHDSLVSRFVEGDVRQFDFSRKRIRERIIGTYPPANCVAKAGSELAILRHEMEKKTRIMPLRKLFESIPALLLTLKPCFMMSPLSVAYFLDASRYKFDMVIFDEASQIFPQDAIGAISRASQVIIAGDTKQLPPTNFFASNTDNSDDELYAEEGAATDMNSILEAAASILPNRTLLWHYRSKHERLISFSNREIYRNELITFPGSIENVQDSGVEFVYVENGYYEGGGRNTTEARRCVELIKEHIDRYPNRSLGIIAFSEKQQNAISSEIQKFREKNPEYEWFFAEDKEDEFFVKNLENVQGDERDTIFFSIGYARTKEQKAANKPMAMRFGPLGLQGGERRLNVAVTRAKENIKLISSILPKDIDLNRTHSEGVRMLRSYIEFAMNGNAIGADADKDCAQDTFVNAIAGYVERQGYRVNTYVGCSGYKVDIGVMYPSDTVKNYVLGIECDGITYSSAKTARDRDRLRGSVLKNMGWNMYRVWSAAWYRDPEAEGKKLLAFIRKAIEANEGRMAELEAAKRKSDELKKLAEEAKRREQAALEPLALSGRDAGKPVRQNTPMDLSWVTIGAEVISKAYGLGNVDEIDDRYITVQFAEEIRRFQFPTCFELGHLVKPSDRT